MQDCNGAQCNTGKADIISNKCRFPELRGRGSSQPMTGEIFKTARLCFLKPQTAFYFIYFGRVVLIVFSYQAGSQSCSDCIYNFIQPGSTFSRRGGRLVGNNGWYFCFCGGKAVGGDAELSPAAAPERQPLNSTLIFLIFFAALMINFFVCRVGSPSSCHGYQPPPAPAAFSPELKKYIIQILKYFLAARTAENIRKLLCCSAPSAQKREKEKARSDAPHRHFLLKWRQAEIKFRHYI